MTVEKVYEGKRVTRHMAMMRDAKRAPEPPSVRFWRMVEKTSGCWPWIGSRDRRSGYGQFRLNGRVAKAHRWAYEDAYGPLSKDAKVLHRCDNPCCVRPDHLFVGSQADNVADMLAKGRGRVSRLAAREDCGNGHGYAENGYQRADGRGRGCRQCDRDKSRRHRNRI